MAGSKAPSRSRGTSISTGPMSVSTVLERVPLRELPPSLPAGSCLSQPRWSVISPSRADSRTVRHAKVQVKGDVNIFVVGKLEEYPQLPEPGPASGTLPGDTFTEAVSQVACAVSNDTAVPSLAGISLAHDQGAGTLTLTTTDRYRFAVRTIGWKHCNLDADHTALAPDKDLLDAAKAAAEAITLDLTLAGTPGASGLFTLRDAHHTTTLRALEGSLPAYSTLFPSEFAHAATVDIAPLKEAAQRVALVATGSTPVRLTFTTDGTLVLEAGTSDEAQAGDLNLAFSPGFLIDGLNGLTTEAAEAVDFHFTSSVKPAILRGRGSDEQGLRYALMPVRLTG